jgi:hypothetical protein
MLFIKSDVLLKKDFHLLFLASESSGFKSFTILSGKLLEAHFVLKDLCIVSLSSPCFLV